MKPWDYLSKAIPNSEICDFTFGVDLVSKSTDDIGRRYIEGVASTPARDLQNETVVQKGMDLKYFLKHGYFNDDHKPGFENKVGQPTAAEIKSVIDSTGQKVTGLFVKGYLWKEGFHNGADSIWELSKALEASESNRCLGFSIQGKVLQREGNNILKAWIQDIAITPSPVNTRTWMKICQQIDKSWSTADLMEDTYKSLSPDHMDRMLYEVGEPQEYAFKTLTAAAASQTVVPESLASGKRPYSNVDSGTEDDDEVEKSLAFAFQYWRDRGLDTTTAQRYALTAVARALLSS